MTAGHDANAETSRHQGAGRALGLTSLLWFAAVPAETAAATRLALPPGLQQTALLCLAEAQRLCPDMLAAKDHGVACLIDKRRQLSQTCRTVAEQAVSFLHGGDVHLDLRALRRHPPRLKLPDIGPTPKRQGGG